MGCGALVRTADCGLVLVLAAPIPPFWGRRLLAPSPIFYPKRPVAFRHHAPSGAYLYTQLDRHCTQGYITYMARINIRLEDGLLERVKGAVPEGQMSAWLVGLMELALDGPKQEDLSTARILKRLDALEDWQASALAPPLVRGGLCPPLEKQERTFVPDGQ